MNCGSKRKFSEGGETGKKDKRVSIKDFLGHPVNHLRRAVENMGKDEDREDKDMKTPKNMKKGGEVNNEFENSKLARNSMNEAAYRPSRGPTTRRRANRMPKYADGGGVEREYDTPRGKKKLSEMTDEERYGKVGAEIRRLDPEAYKKRSRTAEGNLALLKELRAKAKGGEKAPSAPPEKAPSAPPKSGSPRRGGGPGHGGQRVPTPPQSGSPRRGGGPGHGGQRVPSAPAKTSSRDTYPRLPEMVSRREFGSDRRGAGLNPPSDAQLDAALTVAGLIPVAGGVFKGAQIANRAYKAAQTAKAAAATKKAEEAAKVAKELERRRRTMTGSNVGGQGNRPAITRREGGSIKKYAAGGAVRGDGICRVKTKGRMR